MTAVCSGGTSAPKAGVNTSVFVDQTFIQSLLPAALAWLYPYLPFMQGLAIGDVAGFCAVDPPTIPTLPSAADFLAFITGGPIGNAQTVSTFLQNITRAYLWYNLCQCSSLATPTPITPPTNPGNLPTVNPPTISPPGGGACLDVVSHRFDITGINQVCYMIPGALGVQSTSGAIVEYQPFPADATSYIAHWDTGAVSDPSHSVNITLAFYNPANSFAGVQQASPTAIGTSGTFTGAIPAGTVKFAFIISDAGTAVPPSSSDIGCSMQIFCGGSTTGTPSTPCCPPDPVAIGLMTQALNALTLLQRQLAPFAYIAGTVHSGLTGSGQLTVQGLIGAKLIVTASLPGAVGISAGDPDALFGLGWINWGNADGWTARQFIGTTDNISLPQSAGVYTLLGYSLADGVTATITELVREP